MLWLVLKQLRLIASDTQKKEDLNDALDKFGALVMGEREKKKKIVAFKAKDDDDV
jgi:hypothetical protein